MMTATTDGWHKFQGPTDDCRPLRAGLAPAANGSGDTDQSGTCTFNTRCPPDGLRAAAAGFRVAVAAVVTTDIGIGDARPVTAIVSFAARPFFAGRLRMDGLVGASLESGENQYQTQVKKGCRCVSLTERDQCHHPGNSHSGFSFLGKRGSVQQTSRQGRSSHELVITMCPDAGALPGAPSTLRPARGGLPWKREARCVMTCASEFCRHWKPSPTHRSRSRRPALE